MKYAHLADLHIGGWREPKLRDLNAEAFVRSMDMCIAENVDFILFAGDLFNTALPAVEKLNLVAKKLHDLKQKDIPMYIIPGSHDYSHSGKTMIDVLESAGLFINVCKGEVINSKLRLHFTTDKKTGAKITGVPGKKGMLDRVYYEDLDREHLESESGYKIFMFHTSLTELKPKHLADMESQPVSLLPKNFDYYAGGHVHHRMEFSSPTHKLVTQPGALFPNNFAELEKYGNGGFYLIENNSLTWLPVKLREHISLEISCDSRSADEILELAIEEADRFEVENSIVTIRFTGTIHGSLSSIPFNELFSRLSDRGAFIVLKNTAGLHSEEYEEIKIDSSASIEELESALIGEHAQQLTLFTKEKEIELTKTLIAALTTEKKEGETVPDFERRVKENALKVMEIE